MSLRARAGDTAGLCPGSASWKAPRAGFIMACDTVPKEEHRQSCDQQLWSREVLLFNREAQPKGRNRVTAPFLQGSKL